MRTRLISVALQGGGSHGAFTWGVLDRLLEEEWIEFEALSGASAGAMNAVFLAHGHMIGGREGARQGLRDFWEAVAHEAPFAFPSGAKTQSLDSAQAEGYPTLQAWLLLTRFFSPAEMNPLNLNPLREILATQIDFERLRAECPIKLFVAATQVSTGAPHLFRETELTIESMLASTCLPSLHHAPEIGGEHYWDGGFAANPPLLPLVYQCRASDILMILLQPMHRPDVPTGADAIRLRLAEISLSTAFFAELQGLALAQAQIARRGILLGSMERKLRRLRLHMIAADELMSRLTTLSRLNSSAAFIAAMPAT